MHSHASVSTRVMRGSFRFSFIASMILGLSTLAAAQSFSTSDLNLNGAGISQGTSLQFGPDGRLYILQLKGQIDIYEIERTGLDQYIVVDDEQLEFVKNIPNHNDDGTSNGGTDREATGITVAGTATNPVIYATSSDSRIGGPSGDKNLDTNSGVVTRIEWVGTDLDDPMGQWVATDLVRGLPRSEENHATNGLEFVTVGGTDFLIISQGGHANAGSPSNNFAWLTEYALSAAVLSVNLTQLEAMPILVDGTRNYIYDLPTVDDPTRANANGITDPNDPMYDGVDLNDPFGGNDGLNQAKIVIGGPVQVFSPGYRNTYDLVVTASGAVYVTDNGANGGWGGYPENEGLGGNATNNYRPGEPGSTSSDNGEAQVNNDDHLTLVTTDIQSYVFGSFYGGHPAPIRSNPAGAGLFTRGTHSSDPGDSNGNGYTDDWFRTVPFDPNGVGDATDTTRALPADWPPVPIALADAVQGDFRNPGGTNPDGPDDAIVTTWQNNTNGIDEYTASNFGGAMQGDLIAGKNGGTIHRVQLLPDGSLQQLQTNWISGLGGNCLGITCNSDTDPFPGTIWVATFNGTIKVLEPQDFVICIMPGDPGYDLAGDNDSDGYTNADEVDNMSDLCNGGSRPNDFDSAAGGMLVSDLNDPDDDNDGIIDALDPLQLGDPTTGGSDAFSLPIVNELLSDNPLLGGYLGLGVTGLMNNGDANPNWLDWLDVLDAGPNTNDILGGAVGAITMQMTDGTAIGAANDQLKGFQYGAQVDLSTGGFRVETRLLNFDAGFQLYPYTGVSGPGELGIFMGDGTQSNFIAILIDSEGVKVVEEVNDVPSTVLSETIAIVDRPSATLVLRLDVDSASGDITAAYRVNGGSINTIGTFTAASGAVLDAIQQASDPVVVGVIGTSGSPGAEVEGTWDYLNVVGRAPSVQLPIPNLEEPLAGAPSLQLDLDAYFADDDGDANLTYSVQSAADPSFPTMINGNLLQVMLPAFTDQTTITIRATDGSGLFIEQTFTVSVTEALPLFRVNCGGPLIANIDGGPDWEADTAASNSPFLISPGGNNTNGFPMVGYTPEVDLSTTPTAIYDTERWDQPTAPTVVYGFPVISGQTYEVRLYVGNGFPGTSSPGSRVYSVTIEGMSFPQLTDIDLSGTFGHQIGTVLTEFVMVNDGLLEIELLHGVENPLVNAIEIIGGGGGAPTTPVEVAAIADQLSEEGDTINLPVLASGGDTPGSFSFQATGLPPGVQIEPTTGLIFGTVAAGAYTGVPYSVTVTVDDTDGDLSDSVQASFSWEIFDPSLITWTDLNEDESYVARHECAFVQAGDKFFLFGGRQSPQVVDTYDHATDTWIQSAPAPKDFNHFQAVEYQGLVWVVLAFQNNNFPNELSADFVWTYDPGNDVWAQGPPIPAGRKRGGAGLVEYDGKFYCVGGNTDGHDGGYVSWFDEFDPRTGQWTQLPNAPRARDHFHAAVIGDKLYCAGGRLSGGPGGTFAPLIPEVDVYDFGTGVWSTLPSAANLPTPRAGSAVNAVANRLMVMGGEGNSQAYNTVEQLDPVTETWETLPPMNHARHGTQAIVSGGNVFIAAGSPTQGGGGQKNMEVYGDNVIVGAPSAAGDLQLSNTGPIVDENPVSVFLDHIGGNTGVVVESVVLIGADAADFTLLPLGLESFLLETSESREFLVDYVGSADDAAITVEVTTTSGVFTTAVIWDPPLIPVVDLFGATSTTITQGEETTLQWSVSDSTSVDITNVGTGLAASGSATIMPLATTTYDLTAFGIDGTDTASLTITVIPAPAPTVTTFTASDSPIFEGQMATLSWSTTDTQSVDITNVGTGLPASGNAIVSPLMTTAYSLTANGFNGTASAQITIDVVPPPPAPILIQYSASQSTIFDGQSATITWNVLNADSVDISGVAAGLPASGSAIVTPTATTTYSLTGTNFSGTSTASLTITVDPAPPAPVVAQFAASESQITIGDSVTIQWSVTDVTSVDIANLGVGLPASGSAVVSPSAATTYVLSASNFSGSASANLTVDVLVPPVVTAFGASDSVIDNGDSTTLNWSVANATFVDIVGVGTSLPASGSALVIPTATTTYDLTAFGPDGSAMASATVTVQFPPVVGSFAAVDPVIVNGDATMLNWSVSNATSVDIVGVGTNLPATGSALVSPTATTMYDLTATGPDGLAMASVTVVVEFPPVVDTFTSADALINSGDSTTLSWAVSNATTVDISGVGVGLPAVGSQLVSPVASTTYVLTATGPDGTATANVTVDVDFPSTVDSFIAADSTIILGEQTTLSWMTTNATSVDISSVGTGLAADGSAVVAPTSTTTYMLTATGPDGTSTASVTVVVEFPSTVDSFVASSPTITIGEQTTLSWMTTNATSVNISNVGMNLIADGSVPVSPTTTTTYMLTANGPNGSSTSSLTVTVLVPPVISSFVVADPVITTGDTTTLSWSATNATSVDIVGVGTGLPAVGSAPVSPTVSTTYDLTANGPDGSAVASVGVVVLVPPVVDSFFALDPTITIGDSTSLSWSVSNATSVDIPGVGIGLPAIGSAMISPSTTTTYDLTATGPDGTSMGSTSVMVLLPPVVNSFVAADPMIFEGDATLLSWTTSNATSVDIPGVGTGLPVNGSASVSPLETTTYDLTANGPDGSTIASVTVVVEVPLGPAFLRGDVNDDGGIGLVDAIDGLNYLFSGATIACPASLDLNANGQQSLQDILGILNFLFSAGTPPVAPYPNCGISDLPVDAFLPCNSICTPVP